MITVVESISPISYHFPNQMTSKISASQESEWELIIYFLIPDEDLDSPILWFL